jgi:non-homologous end joining protein Ku
MSYRSTWSGSLSLGIVTIAVDAYKASEGYEGEESLRQVCGCDEGPAPFRRSEICEHGRRRLTETMQKAGDLENTTLCLKGLETAEGYVVVAKDRVAEIDDALRSPTLAPLAYIPYDEAPMEWGMGTYILRPSKKAAGAEEPFQRLAEALAQEEKALLAKWCPRGRESVVVLHGAQVGEKPNEVVLYMNPVRFAQEQRDLDEQVLAAWAVKPQPEAVQMMGELLNRLVPSEFDLGQLADDAVAMRAEVYEAAREGKALAPMKAAEPAATAAPDLMAMLKQELAGAEKPERTEPARKAPAKAKAKAKPKAKAKA